MKIKLHNFICYDDAEFDFGNEGIALLSGPSGAGKTSILRGIFFALFGEGTKLQAYGKTSCSVELEFDGMKITRTKRPNRLVVNDVYEDDSAQEIINKKFGDTFKTSGYIQQNNLASFILMSPIDKLAFLEKFAFKDVDLAKIKARCKAHITKRHDELLSVVSQLDMAKNVLEEMEQPDEVHFPLKCARKNRDLTIKNENIRHKNCGTLIRRAHKERSKTQEEINDLRLLKATSQSRQETFDDLEAKLEDLQVEIDDQIYDGDDELKQCEMQLESCLVQRELRIMEDQLAEDQQKLQQMKEIEESSLLQELADIDGSIWVEYSKSELKESIADLKKSLSDSEIVERLRKEVSRCKVTPEKLQERKKELDDLQAELEFAQKLADKLCAQQELYRCPNCQTNLRLLNEKLTLADNVDTDDAEADLDTVKEKISELKRTIAKSQRLIANEEEKLERKSGAEIEIGEILESYEELPDPEALKEDLEYLREYQASQNELEKKKKELEVAIKNEKFSSSYLTFQKGVKKLEDQVSELQEKSSDISVNMNEEELREKIIEQKQTKKKLVELEKQKERMEEERKRCEKILNKARRQHLDKYGNVNDDHELEGKVQDAKKEIEKLERLREGHEKNLLKIEEWKKYQQELENYQVWQDKVDNLEKKEKNARNEYAAATELKDKILEAESIAMLNIIDSINTHARVYLDSFFSENPISVQLQPFKETKKSTSPKINISIEYKGMEADLNMLSGGELSRVILAYTLALGDMFNTPLLLLDECTASLDQDLTSTVFESIRENFNGKMTLLIAHQVITGTFDKVVHLGPAEKSE